ncbi:MAG: methyltransferase domain-containing protein [Bacteroidetes bacterium]|nr:methyltransferase domain-containing protein [Bacteroidota bacterium]
MKSEQDERVYGSGNENLPSNTVTKERLRAYYDRFFESSEFRHYDEGATRKILRSLVRKAGVGEGKTVLDLGCATGFYTDQFRHLGMSSVGIDISSVGVSKARAKYPDLPFVVGDAARLPFKQSSFDILFMSGCSLTNTRDFPAIQSFFGSLTDYILKGGALVVLSASDFSGEEAPINEWIYHTYDEIQRYVDRDSVQVRGPYVTNLRLLSKVGRIALNRFTSLVLRKIPGRRRWSVVYFIGKKGS